MEEKLLRSDVILIDKPYEWTSFGVVKKVRYFGKYKKVGHAGTLDPLATGLLILCTEKKTKEIESYQAQEKEYTGSLVLGKTTPSIDLETEFDGEFPTDHITTEKIQEVVLKLTGSIEQVPPQYSAVKVNGQRAYKAARNGETVEIKSRIIEVKTFEVDTTEFPTLTFRVVCSKGTYIRTLVSDFGKMLDSGAYMSGLRRMRIGEFHVDDAITVEEFVNQNPR
ncbi:MAG: tRNA pseudouridine55 synthase [Spirosomataceae bacterium]|jgi:tRNA pseudouridine55 synthase